MRIKRTFYYTAIFIVGIFCGLVLSEFLSAQMSTHVRKTYVNSLRSLFYTDQTFKATQAEANGNDLDSLIHRFNVVDSFENTNAFRLIEKDGFNFSPLSLYHLYVLKKIGSTRCEAGVQMDEGIQRGKLAHAYDKLGMKSRANNEWEKAFDLAGLPGQTIEEFKKRTVKLYGD